MERDGLSENLTACLKSFRGILRIILNWAKHHFLKLSLILLILVGLLSIIVIQFQDEYILRTIETATSDFGKLEAKDIILLVIVATAFLTCAAIALSITLRLVGQIYYGKGKKRNAKHLIEEAKTVDGRAATTSMDELVEKIAGKDASEDTIKEVEKGLSAVIDPIKDFVTNNEKTLVLAGKWGTGKTTDVIIAINELRKEKKETPTDYRFVYESAFKYVSGFNEFKKDVFNSIRAILSEQYMHSANALREVMNNLNPSAFYVPLAFRKGSITTTDYVWKLNKKYDKLRKKNDNVDPFKIIVILDDIDRLQSKEIIEALSFLSVIRRLRFIKIIVPIDRDYIVRQLRDEGKLTDSEIYIKKYLPDQTEVKIETQFDLFINIFSKKIRKDFDPQLTDEQVRPILENIILKVFSDKLEANRAAINLSSLGSWQVNGNGFPSELLENNEYNSGYILEARDVMYSNLSPELRTKCKHWQNVTNDFEAIVHQFCYSGKRNETGIGDLSLRVDDEIYRECFSKWIYSFAKDRWKRVGATFRTLNDIYDKLISECEHEYINNTLPPNMIFVRSYNKIFPRRPIEDKNGEK